MAEMLGSVKFTYFHADELDHARSVRRRRQCSAKYKRTVQTSNEKLEKGNHSWLIKIIGTSRILRQYRGHWTQVNLALWKLHAVQWKHFMSRDKLVCHQALHVLLPFNTYFFPFSTIFRRIVLYILATPKPENRQLYKH